jgi:hypothetical protein
MKVPVFALAGILVAAPALAWRDVTPEERASIESALAAQGCSGGVMNFDDDKNRFEVHDARCNGRNMEIYLNSSFQIVRMTRD